MAARIGLEKGAQVHRGGRCVMLKKVNNVYAIAFEKGEDA